MASNQPAYEEPQDDRPASAAPTQEVLEDEAIGKAHDAYASLRLPEFRRYLLGWALSVLGGQVLFVAVGWDVFQRTRSPMSLGWTALVLAVPTMLLSLPAGQLADRFDRKKIIVITQIFSSLGVIALAILSFNGASIGWMYVALGIQRCFGVIAWPARTALTPQIVPHHLLTNAAAWNSSIFQFASVAGPALGGALLIRSPIIAYIFTAASGLIFALMLGLMKIKAPPRKSEPANLNTLLAGLRFVWSKQIILATITLDMFAVLFGGAEYLLPVFADEILHCGSVGLGWLRAAPAVGALVMGMVIAHRPPMRHAGRTLLWAVAGFGAAMIVFGLSTNFWLSMAMLAITGALDNISVVVRHTLVQVMTPDAMRGRVAAVNNIFIGASNEIGGFESGLTAKWWGATRAVVFGGVGTILVVAAVASRWPHIRRLGSLQDLKPEQA